MPLWAYAPPMGTLMPKRTGPSLLAAEGSDLYPHLAALDVITLGLEPKQGLLAVLAPLFYIGFKRGAVCDTFQDVAGFQGHRFQGHLEAWLRASEPFEIELFRHVVNPLWN